MALTKKDTQDKKTGLRSQEFTSGDAPEDIFGPARSKMTRKGGKAPRSKQTSNLGDREKFVLSPGIGLPGVRPRNESGSRDPNAPTGIDWLKANSSGKQSWDPGQPRGGTPGYDPVAETKALQAMGPFDGIQRVGQGPAMAMKGQYGTGTNTSVNVFDPRIAPEMQMPAPSMGPYTLGEQGSLDSGLMAAFNSLIGTGGQESNEGKIPNSGFDLFNGMDAPNPLVGKPSFNPNQGLVQRTPAGPPLGEMGRIGNANFDLLDGWGGMSAPPATSAPQPLAQTPQVPQQQQQMQSIPQQQGQGVMQESATLSGLSEMLRKLYPFLMNLSPAA